MTCARPEEDIGRYGSWRRSSRTERTLHLNASEHKDSTRTRGHRSRRGSPQASHPLHLNATQHNNYYRTSPDRPKRPAFLPSRTPDSMPINGRPDCIRGAGCRRRRDATLGFSRTFDDSGPPIDPTALDFPGILGRSGPAEGRLHQKCGRTHFNSNLTDRPL